VLIAIIGSLRPAASLGSPFVSNSPAVSGRMKSSG
jgi:hypothetical protein